MELKINCPTAHTLRVSQLTPLQGALKHRTQKDFNQLKITLARDGQIAPFYVWRTVVDDPSININYILDGHGRHHVLTEMGFDGYVPVVYIDADNIADAKSKLLQINSGHGKITAKGLAQFVEGAPRIILPTSIGVRLQKTAPKVVKNATVQAQATHGIVKLKMPLDKIDMFIKTVENVDYIEVLQGGRIVRGSM
jgi:hypothetical protein